MGCWSGKLYRQGIEIFLPNLRRDSLTELQMLLHNENTSKTKLEHGTICYESQQKFFKVISRNDR